MKWIKRLLGIKTRDEKLKEAYEIIENQKIDIALLHYTLSEYVAFFEAQEKD